MPKNTKAEYKIIADHLRSSCFIIADGALPSNEGRGYVLRRIMRRAMRQLHKLGAREASMYKFVDALIEEMGVAYPELVRARETIIEVLKNEEEKFRETLEKGLKILEEEYATMRAGSVGTVSPAAIDGVYTQDTITNVQDHSIKIFEEIHSGRKKFSGAAAFKLYDTYGFPLDLTQDILKEKNIEVDIEEFNREMESQRNRARASWKGSGEEKEDAQFLELKDKFGATKFLGYDDLCVKAKIIAITLNEAGGNSGIVLDHSPFYATSGGQRGDDGKIFLAVNENGATKNLEQIADGKKYSVDNFDQIADKTKFTKIFETKKFGGSSFVHFVSDDKNNYQFQIGDEVIAQVNPQTRAARARNHSATHLMHKALKQVLGNSISQKGSNVDADSFTFDFNFNRAMTPEEKSKVENLVNDYIAQNAAVKTEIMSLEKARESGAEALFGEKYDNNVRVVSMSPSVELCGGTHVSSTGDIEVFKLVSENGIAAGIRRITAVTSFAVVEDYKKQEQEKAAEEIRKQEQKAKEKEAEKLKKQNILANLDKLKSENLGDLKLIQHVFDDLEAKDLRDIASEIKVRKDFNLGCIFVLFAIKDEKISVCIAITNDLLDKFDATKLITPAIEAIGGKGGGGKKDLAMGGGVNKDGVLQAVEAVRKLIYL